MKEQEACGSNCDILKIDAEEWAEIKQPTFEKKKYVEFSDITFCGDEKFPLKFKRVEHLTFRNCKFQGFHDVVMTADHIGQMKFFDCTFKECKRYIDVTGKVSTLYVKNLLPKRDSRVMLKDGGVVARLLNVEHLKLCRTNFYDCNVEYLPRREYLTIDTQCNCQFKKIASDNVEIEGECITENSCPIYEDEYR